jgi:predicted phosphodiesterase
MPTTGVDVSISEKLANPGGHPQHENAHLPAGWTPSVTYAADGTAEAITIGPGIPTDDEAAADLAQLGVTIPEGFRARLSSVTHDPAAWIRRGQGLDAETIEVTRRKWVIEPAPAATEHLDISELITSIGKKRPTIKTATGGVTAIIAIADLQLGESDRAGGVSTDDTLTALFNAFDQATHHIKRDIKRGHVTEIAATFLGDCVQGFLSQNGTLTWRTDLTVTEMLRVYRRVALELIKRLADLGVPLQVIAVGGNHGEATRNPQTRYDDNHDVEAVIAVADTLQAVGGYDHVTFTFPTPDDDMVTVKLQDGTVLTCVHGHQWTGPASSAAKWWAGQALGRTRHTGDILLSGHRHHLYLEDIGGRWAITAPAMVGPSAWWTRKTGQQSRRGLLTLEAAAGTITNWRLF